MSDRPTFHRDTEPWIAAAACSEYGHPEEDPMLLQAISPLRAAANIDIPLLVVHGQLDTNVPIGEAPQIVAALSAFDGPVEYLEPTGEGLEYRRADSCRTLIARIRDLLVTHV
jgi:dipeptidyl aminopeptidase/acylaminoacyl peptidase